MRKYIGGVGRVGSAPPMYILISFAATGAGANLHGW
jgi:hypothetical protein